jgi:hypothetical protein
MLAVAKRKGISMKMQKEVIVVLVVLVGTGVACVKGGAKQTAGQQPSTAASVKAQKWVETNTAAVVVTSFQKGDVTGLVALCSHDVQIQGTPAGGGPGGVKRFSDFYTEFFAKTIPAFGQDKWRKLVEKIQPTVTTAEQKDRPIEGVEPGDIVLDLHFREAIKGERNGLDEAVIFVLRKSEQGMKIVSHYADY